MNREIVKYLNNAEEELLTVAKRMREIENFDRSDYRELMISLEIVETLIKKYKQ